jgi:pimeloyl-ACP methyl ester carboxylesterase
MMTRDNRPLIVLLHSSASSSRQWDRLMTVLPARYRAVALDLHGHGRQLDWRGPAPLALADDAALVAPLLAESDHVHLVGHSYGAAVALKVASMHPSAVRSVVAFEPVLFRLLTDCAHRRAARPIATIADAIFSLTGCGRCHDAAQRFVDFWAGGPAWEALPESKQGAIAARMPIVAQHFGALMHEPAFRFAELARLDLPLLFLQGESTVGPMRELMQLVRLALPDALHQTLPAMGHMGPITDAEIVNRRIVEFLSAQRAGVGESPSLAMDAGFDQASAAEAAFLAAYQPCASAHSPLHR